MYVSIRRKLKIQKLPKFFIAKTKKKLVKYITKLWFQEYIMLYALVHLVETTMIFIFSN